MWAAGGRPALPDSPQPPACGRIGLPRALSWAALNRYPPWIMPPTQYRHATTMPLLNPTPTVVAASTATITSATVLTLAAWLTAGAWAAIPLLALLGCLVAGSLLVGVRVGYDHARGLTPLSRPRPAATVHDLLADITDAAGLTDQAA